ncbi:outer dense fiber protein 3B [Rhinatrema bivittatum]|uniref:outer dense fiber protein 3B n=1 Tax=Rhinatrema bivittatum TaxID=194408 RepID=UPI00112A779C|nr:outer dense fiber protein 3B [Rhinatrema bivittatum]XP_029472496.1 outer dense fiber protein 3B [Rhinatrema bivittatum]XP_029472497.1 outer dense fiber protein 3B [Rhinatrema bivittatum]XP_029472500.1 outer dense fiber protein 3B [Rhinatrema bivittatum]
MGTDPWVGTWRPHRARGPIAAMYGSPGPKYGLPSNTGYTGHDPSKNRAPAYSIASRHIKFVEDCSPGPGYLVPPHMTMRGKDGIPAYSLYGRPKDISPFNTPGPGTYSPERSGKSAYYSPPMYSMAARTKGLSSDQSPGPAAYMLPSMLGPKVVNKSSAPYYSVTGRSKTGSFHEDLQKTPGPGTYRVVDPGVYKYRPPHYSMTARTFMPSDTTQKPGPGAHSPEKVLLNKRQAPNFSFGIKHSDYLAPLIVDVAD